MFGRIVRHLLLVLLIFLGAGLPAHGQGILSGIFKRPRHEPMPPPSTKAPELIAQPQPTDVRPSTPAEDTRQGDVKFYDAIRALIYSLEHDANPTVRAEAVQNLGRMRPVTQAAGQAVERAASKDAVLRVRFQAWSALKSLQLAGYRNRGPAAVEEYIAKGPPAAPQTNGSIPVDPRFPQGNASTPLYTEPVALTPTLPTPPTNNYLELRDPEPAQFTVPRPLPVGAPWSTAVPTTPRRIVAPPEVIQEAPSLTPPPATAPQFNP